MKSTKPFPRKVYVIREVPAASLDELVHELRSAYGLLYLNGSEEPYKMALEPVHRLPERVMEAVRWRLMLAAGIKLKYQPA